MPEKSDKKANEEYREAGLTSESLQPARTTDQEGTSVGNIAPETVYLDTDGNIVDNPGENGPERGKVLVRKGDTVTQSIADKLSGR